MMSPGTLILDRAPKGCNGRTMKTILCTFIAVMAINTPASAANSEWTRTPGGSVRLVIDNPAQQAREIRGAIQINLDPGWKTYWREPGDAGVPPELDLASSTNVKSYTLSFPKPHRFDDGNTHWAGYKKSVALPVTVALTDPTKPTRLKGHVFLGICETICIPVTAEFDIPVDSSASDSLTKTLIENAFLQLPGEASATFGAISAVRKDDHVKVTVNVPDGDPDPDIFVAGDGTTTLGMAKLKRREANTAMFSVPIVTGKEMKSVLLSYTLVQGEKAVSGKIDLQE